MYCCAACFYAALTGFLPPESLDRLEHDTLTPVSQVVPEAPEWLDKAILKGLAVQPEDRFQSAAEFLDAIENQLVVDVPTAGQAAPAPQTKPKTALIACAAAALVVVVGVGAFLAGRGGSAPQNGPNPPSNPAASSALDPFPTDTPEPEPVTLHIGGEEHQSNETYLSLWQLDLTQEDIEAICQMENLTDLNIYECYSDDDFAFLPRLTGLKNLDWTLHNGEQLAVLADCPQLTSLRFGWGSGKLRTSNLDFLAGLTQLEHLDVGVYGLEDISALANLTKLTYFSIDGAQIHVDLGVLAGMTEMEELYVNMNSVMSDPGDRNGYYADDLGFLSGMSKLTKAVFIFEDHLSDLSGLEGAVSLRELSLDAGKVPTLEPMAALTSLRNLRLNVDSPVSLEPLRNLEKLDTFTTYTSGRFSDWSALDHVPNVDKRA